MFLAASWIGWMGSLQPRTYFFNHINILNIFLCRTCLWKYSIHYLGYVYTWIGKRRWLAISSIFLRTKDFSRSQPVKYTVNVVIFWKWCQIALILLQTTNRKCYMRICECISFKLAVLAYQAIHGTGPSYYQSCFTRVSDMPSRRPLRSSGSDRLHVPIIRRSTVGSRTFTAYGAAVWNDLPAHVTAAPSLAVFRQHLKTFLFSRSYPEIVTWPINYVFVFYTCVDLAITLLFRPL